MFVHCTSYSDDRQVMQYIGDEMEKRGFKSLYGAADHINFKEKQAYCILDNNKERKTKYDLVSVYKGDRLVNMDSQAPNKVFGEWAHKFFENITFLKRAQSRS